MKKILKAIFYPFFGIVLNILSWGIEPFLEVANFFTVIWEFRNSKGFWKNIGDYNKSEALDRDIFAGRNYRAFFNKFFITEDAVLKFGKIKISISAIIGYNRIHRTLKFWGWFWYYFLYLIDFTCWRSGGHCVDSINKAIREGKLIEHYFKQDNEG